MTANPISGVPRREGDMEHPAPAQLTCIAVGAYRGALTYGAAYIVLAISTADGRSQVKLRDDRGRVRWYPLRYFAPAGSPAPQLVAVQLIDSLDAVQTSAIEVELQLSTGDRRWCAFARPEALAHFGDTLPGTAVRIHAAPNLIILSELSEERIRQALQLLLEDGRLLDHTLPLDETPLAGGNLTPVVRVGDSVRRAQGPWSPAVHALLRHLEQSGFGGAPRFRGVDAECREILSYLPGSVGFAPAVWREDSLVAAARLLHAYHDATRSFVPPADAQWQLIYPDPSQHEVLCHNDVAPYNLVFVDGLPTALIDFDLAGPGPRLWDLAYALYWFAPLYLHDLPEARGLHDLDQTSRRVHLFCDAYGIAYTPRLLDFVEARLAEMCARLSGRVAAGDVVAQRMVAEGHLAGYAQGLAIFRQHRPALELRLA